VAGALCGCPDGQKRVSQEDQCRPVESWLIPIWVLRRNQNNLQFNQTLANPLHPLTMEYVRLFEQGVAQCYPNTALRQIK
jgi:hypothetical protein